MAAGAKPKRTIRIILWTGEEQGLMGSRSYVERHKDQLDKISAVFVDDGGTNYEGGVPAADCQVEWLAAATAPTNNEFYDATDRKFLNVNVRPTGPQLRSGGGSDHVSFNQAGVPGFYWDEVGRATYGYGWHTQHDRIDLAIPNYLAQSATNSAITAYNLACAEGLLPRPPKAEEGNPK
jgi:Zn-dependent M28 family amino/carboxypeptidase